MAKEAFNRKISLLKIKINDETRRNCSGFRSHKEIVVRTNQFQLGNNKSQIGADGMNYLQLANVRIEIVVDRINQFQLIHKRRDTQDESIISSWPTLGLKMEQIGLLAPVGS